MENEKFIIEFLVSLGESNLMLSGDFVGKVMPFKFRDIEYEIIFPRFIIKKFPDLDSCYSTLQRTRARKNWIQTRRNELTEVVAKVYSYNPEHNAINSFYTNRIIVQTKNKVDEQNFYNLKDNLFEWSVALVNWIGAIRQEDLQQKHTILEENISDSMIEAYLVDSIIVKFQNRSNTSFIHTILEPISSTTFEKALRKASSEEALPIFHILLVSAMTHYNNKIYRQSVLDAATALEVAMTQLLENKLVESGFSTEQIKIFLRKFKQITGLKNGLFIVGINMNQSIIDFVATPRNKAMHEGQQITQDQSKNAIFEVKNFINNNFQL